jgi:hypothetical protein
VTSTGSNTATARSSGSGRRTLSESSIRQPGEACKYLTMLMSPTSPLLSTMSSNPYASY